MTLHEALAAKVSAWKSSGYPVEEWPAIGEILDWAHGVEDSGNVRFLRPPQLLALDTYWYLRLVERTPHVLDLYRRLFTGTALLEALGLGHSDLKSLALDLGGVDDLLEAVRTDDALVKRFKLEAVRETLALDYPSYILALAMGAGKTILMGAIIASEFAMAGEYPDGPFVQNALVFAPGKTPIESLRELLSAPYESMLPPRFHKAFAASVKFTFTRDGDPDIPVIARSLFNVVVTNTEKIRIQKDTIRKSDLGTLFNEARADEAKQDVANRRLTKIAQLPKLAVFSDEAHHTYGQSLSTELKKVRKTVDYLHQQTDLVCVVNTTGTPYFERQLLRDVVVWYGLSQGIRDNILKDVSGSIQEFDFGGETGAYLQHVVTDFFTEYGHVALPNGAPARLAIYFPQTDDVAEFRPVIEAVLASMGLSPSLVLVNTSNDALTTSADIDAFNRLNDPAAPHRVMLLVNKGTEGWNCPSLFACALARRLKTSNNFVLQAASRCLRQVPGNSAKARIYLSRENHAVLDRQLKETYGEDISELGRTARERKTERLVLRKVPIAPIPLRHIRRSVTAIVMAPDAFIFTRPADTRVRATKAVFSLNDTARRVLQQSAESVAFDLVPDTVDLYTAAAELAGRYRLDTLAMAETLLRIYPEREVPEAHIEALAEQLEHQTRRYEVREEPEERLVSLVKEEAFNQERTESGAVRYWTDIAYAADRSGYLVTREALRKDNRRDLGFHFNPIEFDSQPERAFYEQVLRKLNLEPWDVDDVYFTGGLTDPSKTDFFVEYRGLDGKVRRYTPDFVIRKKPQAGQPAGSGRILIVEIKREKDRSDEIDGVDGRKARAVKALRELNADRLEFEMIFTATDSVTYDQLKPVWRFSETRDLHLPLPMEEARLAEFCRKWHVAQLEVFGSVLRTDFRPDSDVDFLVTFKSGHTPGFDFFHMKEELKALVGRDVDLLTRNAIERNPHWIRKKSILTTARPIYVG